MSLCVHVPNFYLFLCLIFIPGVCVFFISLAKKKKKSNLGVLSRFYKVTLFLFLAAVFICDLCFGIKG